MLGFSFYWKSKWDIFVNAVVNFIWKANNKDKIICFCGKDTNFDETWCQSKAIVLLNFKCVNLWFGTHIIHNYIQRSCCSCVLCCFSCVWLCVTQWTVTLQAPLSIGILQTKIWSGLPCPPPGYLPNQGIEPMSLMSSALAGRFFTTSATWKFIITSKDAAIFYQLKWKL